MNLMNLSNTETVTHAKLCRQCACDRQPSYLFSM